MPQHDMVIANATASAVRGDINNALSALVALNSGATEPTVMYAHMLWSDTTANKLKMRNAANDAWIVLGDLNQTTDVFTAAVSQYLQDIENITFAQGDILYFNGTDLVKLAKGTAGQLLAMNSGATAPEWIDGGWPAPDYTSSGSPSTPTGDTNFTFTHGLGDYPSNVQMVLRCVTAQHGFAVNDRSILHPMNMFWDGTDAGFKIEMDTTQIRVRSAASVRVLDDSGNRQTITASNFEFWVNAWA